MTQQKRLIAIFIFLFWVPAIGAVPSSGTIPKKTPDDALAKSVVYQGTILKYWLGPDNFREVIPETLYRANLLEPQLLSNYITTHGLKTIINLIGEQPQEEWWHQENDISKRHNVVFYNIPLIEHEYMKPEHLELLFNIFSTTQAPIMMHCKRGVDRTGIAIALWLLEEAGASHEDASLQLSYWRYGHHGSKHPQLLSFLKLWAALRGRFDRTHALQEYREIYNHYELGEMTKLKIDDEKLQSILRWVDQTVDDLQTGKYKPLAVPPAVEQPCLPVASSPMSQKLPR